MRTGLLVAVLAGAGLVLVPPLVAHAQSPGGDSAIGTGNTGFAGFSFDFSAQSGPSGENPSGEAFVGCCGDLPFITVDGPVTCLAVSGNRAVIGVQNTTGTAGNDYAEMVVVDGGPGGAQDSFTAALVGLAPPDCVSGFTGGPITGDITVLDAPPLPTSPAQCKNGGWRNYPGFRNQGQCVSFVATRGQKP